MDVRMPINLQKGQKIDLTKTNPGLTDVTVGLGWDPVQKSAKSGLFGAIRTAVSSNIDCDASVLLLQQDRLVTEQDIVSFRKLQSNCGTVRHSGDNLTGHGNGDDEQVFVALNNLPAKYNKIVFIVNIFAAASRKQDFGMIQNAFIRLVNSRTNEELVRYDLSENYAGKTSLILGELYRHNGEWKFAALGTGTNDVSIKEVSNHYK